jgi:hypothetical protein
MTKNTKKDLRTNIKLNETYKRKRATELSYKKREKWPSYCLKSCSYKEA